MDKWTADELSLLSLSARQGGHTKTNQRKSSRKWKQNKQRHSVLGQTSALSHLFGF